MSNFHSTTWRMNGQAVEMIHEPENSHSGMIAKHKWRENKPNEKTRNFEAEWDGVGALPSDTKLIRNCNECPERLRSRIREHYKKLSAAITTGKHLDYYFKNSAKYSDVWQVAIKNNAPLPAGLTTVGGSIYVRGYQHPLPAGLTTVGGYLYMRGYQHPLPAGLTKK